MYGCVDMRFYHALTPIMLLTVRGGTRQIRSTSKTAVSALLQMEIVKKIVSFCWMKDFGLRKDRCGVVKG